MTKNDHQRFCSNRCRKEFWANGASFGPLRDKLPGFIKKEAAKQLAELTARIDTLQARIALLEEKI